VRQGADLNDELLFEIDHVVAEQHGGIAEDVFPGERVR
jgi:hypothetical protein